MTEETKFTLAEGKESSVARFMEYILDKYNPEPAPLRRCGLTKEQVKRMMVNEHIKYLTDKSK